MKVFIYFVLKEIKHIVRDKHTMLILFGMPIMMMLLLGFAVRTDVRNIRAIVVTNSINHVTHGIIKRLDASSYFNIVTTAPSARVAEHLIRAQKADIAIVFMPRYSSLRSYNHEIQIMADGADPNMAQQYAHYAEAVIMSEGMDDYSRAVNVKQLYNPQMQSAYNFVPGIMGMLLTIICAMMTSISIVREKERGTMELLLVSPVRPLGIIFAKAVPYMLLSFIILIVILCMSFYVLQVPLAGSLFWIFMLSLVYILLALALGLIISNKAQTQLAALLISAMVLLMPCLMLSGMLFPVESMPVILRAVAHAIPTTYYIAAMRKLMIMGVDISNITYEFSVLGVYALFLLVIAIKTFKKRLQ